MAPHEPRRRRRGAEGGQKAREAGGGGIEWREECAGLCEGGGGGGVGGPEGGGGWEGGGDVGRYGGDGGGVGGGECDGAARGTGGWGGGGGAGELEEDGEVFGGGFGGGRGIGRGVVRVVRREEAAFSRRAFSFSWPSHEYFGWKYSRVMIVALRRGIYSLITKKYILSWPFSPRSWTSSVVPRSHLSETLPRSHSVVLWASKITVCAKNTLHHSTLFFVAPISSCISQFGPPSSLNERYCTRLCASPLMLTSTEVLPPRVPFILSP
mmetsp:Transcript_461/g.1399  ORF Transcript_461/g.1399 Transcript_461/m.1399 type:complete len:267 (-) Transcript_461:785-1585(-)